MLKNEIEFRHPKRYGDVIAKTRRLNNLTLCWSIKTARVHSPVAIDRDGKCHAYAGHCQAKFATAVRQLPRNSS